MREKPQLNVSSADENASEFVKRYVTAVEQNTDAQVYYAIKPIAL
jgi:hypothetical protein